MILVNIFVKFSHVQTRPADRAVSEGEAMSCANQTGGDRIPHQSQGRSLALSYTQCIIKQIQK